jgi:hypothetical protein
MRKTWINLHLYVAAFFLPLVLLVSISGGLYLVGIKGTVDTATHALPASAQLDFASDTLIQDVRSLLASQGMDADFEYLKVSGGRVTTRPTSRDHFILSHSGAQLVLQTASPNLQSRLIELHKGHGPGWFKTLQKAFAVGLAFVVLSGAWLGLSAPALRVPTATTIVAGTLLALGLAVS